MKRASTILALLFVLALACNLPGDSGQNGDGGEDIATQRPRSTIAPPESPPLPTSIPEEDKWDLWDNGVRLRGADLHPCQLYDENGCVTPITRQDIADLRNLGANLINASYPGVYSVDAPYEVDDQALAYLDDLVEWAEEVGIYVVIHFRSGPGRNEEAIHLAPGERYEVWTDQAAHDAWGEMWRFVAQRYRESPVVIGYDLMVEPHPNTLVDPDFDLSPSETQAQMEGTLMDWNALAADITAAIREVDSDTPIIINSLNWGSAEWFEVLEPTGDDRTVYSLHAYDPDVYVDQEPGAEGITYPDVVEDYGETITFNRAWLEENFQPPLEFAERYDVPIYIGEFGVMRWAPDAAAFLEDELDLFEEYGWNYAVYVWRGDEVYFDGFNLELGPDPDNHSQVLDNPLLNIFRQAWAQNTHFPGSSSAPPVVSSGEMPSLDEVSHWLYLIDVNLDEDTVDQIVASTYDMVVLDYIPSEENNTDYPMAQVIDRMHNAAHPKLVIAYIDIGEAEDYRTYWQDGWGIGDPEWIAGADPDGWEGNYPVAYWWDEYQEIWTGTGGYLQGILDAGFDGVYLDWVEAYSDESVLDIAEQDGVDAVQEMIWWVGDIAEFTRDQKSDFIVIAQNAAELAEFDDYVEIIDAIAQEQVWFDGGADNDPPGDCPLPRTDDDIDTDEYYDSLSPECQQQFDDYPDSTLHVSSEEYLYYLQLAQSKGLLIFTIDYALDPANVAWVYQTSRSLGFVPFVSSRALDIYLDPVP